MLEYGCLLSLILDCFELFLQLFVLSLIVADLFLADLLLLVDGLIVALILYASVFFEGAP